MGIVGIDVPTGRHTPTPFGSVRHRGCCDCLI